VAGCSQPKENHSINQLDQLAKNMEVPVRGSHHKLQDTGTDRDMSCGNYRYTGSEIYSYLSLLSAKKNLENLLSRIRASKFYLSVPYRVPVFKYKKNAGSSRKTVLNS
jgi:hypothetical protein